MIEKFVEQLKAKIPNIQLRYKDESIFMMILGKILFFNQSFMTDYTTTIGSTVYFPSREYISKNPISSTVIMAHESVHICDANRIGSFLFSLQYLMPQIFVLLIIPAIFVIGWWSVLFLLFALPLPAYFRMKLELRGYNMTLFASNEYLKNNGFSEGERRNKLEIIAKTINETYFCGVAYYWMWIFGVKFDKTITDILTGDILKSDEVYSFVKQSFPK